MGLSVATSERPATRPWHAVTRLDDFALVTWTAELDAVRRLLPEGVDPDLVPIDGTPQALVSMVCFHEHGFRVRAVPFARTSWNQIDYRLYVRRGEEPGVFFLGATFNTLLATIPRTLWGLPSRRAAVDLDATWRDGRLDALRLRSSERRRAEATTALHLASSETDAREDVVLPATVTDPLTGWYHTRRDRLIELTVWHDELVLRPAACQEARSAFLERLRLIDRDQPPVSALVTEQTRFDVLLPPRAV